MNKLESFIERQDKIIREDREKTLISLGLTEKEYSPDNRKSAKYPYRDYINGEERYYRDVAMQVTDEEWAQILEKLETVRQIRERESREKAEVCGPKKLVPIYQPSQDANRTDRSAGNGVSAIAGLLRIAGWVLAALTLIVGFVSLLGTDDILPLLISLGSGALTLLLFYALAEILDGLAHLRAIFKSGWKYTESNK